MSESEEPVGAEAASASEDPLAEYRARLKGVRDAVPHLEPLRPGRAVTLVSFLLLLALSALGAPPSAPLASPTELLASAGRPAPNPGSFERLEDSFEWRHTVRSGLLEVDFDAFGELKAARARGAFDEPGLPPIPVLREDAARRWLLELYTEDDHLDRDAGSSARGLLLFDDGLRFTRRFFADDLSVDFQASLGRDADGEARPFLDLILRFRSEGSRRLSFGYEFEPVEGLTFDVSEATLGVWGAGVERDRSTGEARLVSVNMLGALRGGARVNESLDQAVALAFMTRYGLVALSAVDDGGSSGSSRARRRGEVALDFAEGSARLVLNAEGLQLEPGESFVHHYRLVLGAKSALSLAGHEPEVMADLTSDSFKVTRLFRELELDFLRGFARLFGARGFALLVIGLLTALMLRPMTLTAAWVGARGALLIGSFRAVAELRKLTEAGASGFIQRREIRRLAGQTNAEIGRRHGHRRGFGCLSWLAVLPILFGFYDAVYTGAVLRKASFLWIDDIALPDRLMVFEQPLFELPFHELFAGLGLELGSLDLTFTLDALNLLPIVLYALSFVERVWLMKLGVRGGGVTIFGLIWLLLFLLLFYNLAAGAQLAFIVVRSVWMVDRIRVYRHLNEELARVAEAAPGDE